MSLYKAVMITILMVLPLFDAAQTHATNERGESKSEITSDSLRNRHNIKIGIGLMSKMTFKDEVSADGVIAKSTGDGFLGSIIYTYWLKNNLAINLSVGVLNADATVSVSSSDAIVESAIIVPMLFGIKYEPFVLAVEDVIRPYVSASVGPFFGSASNVRAGLTTATESYSETVLGSHLAVGVDLSLSKLFTLGVGAGYYLVSDFEKRIGSEKNYSSPNFSIMFGVVF